MEQQQQQHLSFYDAVPDGSYYPIAVVSCLTCLVLFKYVSPYVSRKIWRGYSHLPEGVRMDWDTRMVSMVHAPTVSILAAYSHLFDDAMHTNLVWWDCFLVRAACAITVGFMISELIILTVYFKYLGEMEYYFHHSASVYAFYYVLSYPVMPFYANFRLLSEISTPFFNIRWFLLTMGFSKFGHTSFLNFIVLSVTFFFCRVLAIPVYWTKVHVVSQMDGFDTLGYLPVVLVVTCVVLDSLNLFWFLKMSRILTRSLLAFLRSAVAGRVGGPSGGGSSSRNEGEKREAKRVKAG